MLLTNVSADSRLPGDYAIGPRGTTNSAHAWGVMINHDAARTRLGIAGFRPRQVLQPSTMD